MISKQLWQMLLGVASNSLLRLNLWLRKGWQHGQRGCGQNLGKYNTCLQEHASHPAGLQSSYRVAHACLRGSVQKSAGVYSCMVHAGIRTAT